MNDRQQRYYYEIKNIAEQKGGKVLSDKYENTKFEMWFQCSNGHIFDCRPDHIKANRWCPTCVYDKSMTNFT